MKTINQNLYFLHLFITSRKHNLVNKPLLILFLFLISIYPISFSQDFSNRLNDDSVIVKPDYRNHLNIPEYNPGLFPLNRQVSSTGVWTELNPKVPRVDYIGVNFINKDTGWACGANGTIIKTTNGGTDWSVSETNTTLPILKVKSFNGQIVIASGYDGLILRSIDGGESFTQITSGVTSDLWGLEIVNDTLGWACGATTLFKTTDAGENWQIINTPGYTGNLWAIEFLNNSYGFIAADGKVLRTTNEGNSWEIILAGDNQSLYIVDIIDSLHIAAAGYGGTSYRGKNMYSSDGGFTWITGGPLTFEPVNDIKYVNRDTGYVVMNNTIGFKTTNCGQQWTGIAVGGDWEMQFFKEQNIGYSAGTGLRVYKTENSFENWQRLIINDNFSDVFFINEETGFAISGVLSVFQGLYKTTNGGVNWNGIPGPSGEDILFLDSLKGFICGETIYKTSDGGDNWYPVNLNVTTGPAMKIFFINATTGWATTTYSSVQEVYILKTTDGGENWFAQFSGLSFPSFTGISFVDSVYGWVSCLGGRPLKTTNGGNNWIQQTNLDIWASRDIYFTNRDTGWIVDNTSWSTLKKTIDGGINWISMPEILNPFEFHLFPDRKHWIINGTPQKYITEDGGVSWIDITNDAPSGFNSFCSVTDFLGYAVGGLGLILKYNDTSYVPVELISFEGRIDNEKIILNWQTASELNNKGFQVEKSFNNGNWFSIGFVNGNGTTTELNYYSFVDKELAIGIQYYRLKQIDYDGSFEFSYLIEIKKDSPTEFNLYQNYPNPFNPETNISYSVEIKTRVNISLFDITGEKIKEIINEEKQPGYYTVKLKGGNFSSGIYFYRLFTSSGYTAVKKLTIIK